MYWRSEEGDAQLGDRLLGAADKGHQIVMTPQTHCYFDYHQDPEWFHEPSGAIGTVTLKDAYSLDPIPHGLREADHRNILGGQCIMWNDGAMDLPDVKHMPFSRVLALAEVVWSPPEIHDFDSLMSGVPVHLRRLEALNVNSRYPDSVEFTFQDGWLTLEPELKGAEVHFTLNGGQPTSRDTVYTGPVEVLRPTLVRAAIVRDDDSIGRVKSFMAGSVIKRGLLNVVLSTDSAPDHPPTELAGRLDWENWITVAGIPFPHEIVFDLGLVGESGCGKSTLGRCIAKLYDVTAGDILFRATDDTIINLSDLSARQMLPIRKELQIVFQDPYAPLDPE